MTLHHARAVVRCAADGLAIGLFEAAEEHPARSRGRRRLYLVGAVALVADTVVQQEPWLRSLLEGTPPEPPADEDRHVVVRQTAIVAGWWLVVTVADRPLASALRRHGVRRPHVLMGVLAGVATAASTLPGWWRQADERAAVDRATARLDEELAELLDQPAG